MSNRAYCWTLAIVWSVSGLVFWWAGKPVALELTMSAIFGCAAMVLDELAKWGRM